MIQFDPIERVSFTISAGAVGAAYAFAPAPFAAGVAIGAALEAVNLRIQARAARLLFDGELVGGRPWVAGFGLRYALMAIGMLAALQLGTDPAGLVVGVSLAIPGVVLWAWMNRPAVVPAEQLEALEPDDPSWDRWSVWRAAELPEPQPEDEEEE